MADWTVIPAIDLKGGRCVRLRQGVAAAETVYADDPVAVARQWEAQGAAWLHVVDLDGAFQGAPAHTELIARLARAVRIPIEVGGGLRDDAQLQRLLDAGVARVILGTRACREPDAVARLAERYGARLAVGLDARGGRVQIAGWTETTTLEAVALARQLAAAGVRTLIYTDTATDGMLAGPNLTALAAVCDAATCEVIASGGVAAAAHVTALRRLGKPNLKGVIVGKALYDGAVTLAELLRAK